MVGKEEHLSPTWELAEDLERGLGALVVEMHEDVVDHEGNGIVVLGVPFERRNAERQEKLIARAVAHAPAPGLAPVAPHSAQHRGVLFVEIDVAAELKEPKVSRRKSSLARARMGPWFS